MNANAFPHLRVIALATGLLSLALINIPTGAAEFQGATSVLKQAAERSDGPAGEKPKPVEEWRRDAKKLAETADSLPPSEAARQWVTLAERFEQLGQQMLSGFRRTPGERPLTPNELFEALPGPSAWTELEKQVEAAATGTPDLRQLGLQLLVHTLTRNDAKRQSDIEALEKFAQAKKSRAQSMRHVFQQLNEALIDSTDDPQTVLTMLERRLASQSAERNYGYNSFAVPNLVPLVGAEAAETFLRKALMTGVQLHVPERTATQQLAQKLALELIKELKAPQWELVNTLDSLELYEALERQFKKDTNATAALPNIPGLIDIPQENFAPQDYRQTQAKVYYLLGLVSRNRTADAIRVAKELGDQGHVFFPEELTDSMRQAGFAQEVFTFFHQLLDQNPEVPFWEQFVSIAAYADQTPRMLELVRNKVKTPDLDTAARQQLQGVLYRALLAAGQVEEGVAELRKLMTNASPKGMGRMMRIEYSTGAGLQLARIGKLLNNSEWLDAGLAAARSDATNQPDENLAMMSLGIQPIAYAMFLNDLGRGAEAETVLAKALKETVNQPKDRYNTFQRSAAVPVLLSLAKVYHDAGRHADVITLFESSPDWGTGDLAALQAQSSHLPMMGLEDFYQMKTPTPSGYYLASALGKTGRTAEAQRITEALLTSHPGNDRLYELLLSLSGDDAPAQLDALLARDQFQERPLIWKAHWLRQKNRLAEAETTARKAISIDPSDGEQGPGDRLRAYAELAEIRAAVGDTNEAAILHGAVRAIREAEAADQFHAAGLLKRAVEMYENSLRHFADAYCIQSRLAVQLADMGRHEEAEAHYQRAYELMPDSFGRVESHCFGCERAFSSPRAQTIAEKVFQGLVEKNPRKPQLHYLLGYLRQEQHRAAEAADHFRKAVELDPDYLNAWGKLQGLQTHLAISRNERSKIATNILRLDPLGQHVSASLSGVDDLAAVWNAIADARKRWPAMPESLFPLPKSQAVLEARKANATETEEMDVFQMDFDGFPGRNSHRTKPAVAISENQFIRAAQNILQSGQYMVFDQ